MKIMRLTLRLGVLFALVLRVAVAYAQAQQGSYTKYEYMIPMRDGIRLYTAVYVPKNRPGKHPILLERTGSGAGPYGPNRYRRHRGSPKFVENGYIFTDQDVRGQGHSQGVFVQDRPQLLNPLKPQDIDESTDAYDTIDYLVRNVPDNNGRVGLWGISNRGFYAAVGAINSHPALRAASPQAPASDWFLGDDFHHNGALFLMDAARSGPHDPDTGGDPYKFYLEHGALFALTNAYFKEADGLWRDLMEHGAYDEYWQARNLPHNMRNVHCAVMTVGGWFDAEDLWGALHTARATAAQNKNIPTMLVMGPWSHGMWADPTGDRLGDQDFGQPTSAFFQNKIEFPFFDAFLRGNGKRRLPAARVFETGANRWRTFPQWPPREAKPTDFYLLPGMTIGTTAPTDTDWFPLVDRNPQQFMDIYTAKPEDFQTATIHIHRAAAATSHLRVGVLPAK